MTLHTTLLGPLTVPDSPARAAELEELSRRAALYATRAKGDGTRRTYRSAWRQYEAWCATLGREPLAGDPDTLAMYVVRCADQGLAVSSIRVALAAIATAHRLARIALDLRHPRLAMVLEGVTRTTGVRPRRQAAPAVPGVLRLMLGSRTATPADGHLPGDDHRPGDACTTRAGLATAAGDQGAGLAELMRQTRHKSTEVALGCLRPADLWRNNVTAQVFGGDGGKRS